MCDIPMLFGEFANFQSTCESNPEILSVSYRAFNKRLVFVFYSYYC